MNKTYYGNYLGIVVQNDDPEHRGRVKIFVPHISVTLYTNWNENKQDKHFIFPDAKTNPDLSKVMGPLKNILPWAEPATPLFGGGSKARYNAPTDSATTSDSNYWEGDTLVKGNRPVQNYIGSNKYPDAFTETGKNRNRFVNQYANEYIPSNYSNLARGLFSIPNVGAHLWVFFAGGNPRIPIYFAESHGKEDWKRIYSTSQESEKENKFVDYPGSYENFAKEESPDEIDKKTFRSKVVFNSNKHAIELIDTDNREILKMTHFSGSFKEFNNISNIEFATNNDQKMIIGDQFYTVNKNQSLYVGESQEVIVAGDRYKTIGKDIIEKAKQIYTILAEIHEYKRLFEGQRALVNDPLFPAPNEVSKYQKRNGVFAICPRCKNRPYNPDLSNWQVQPTNWQLLPGTGEDLVLGKKFLSYIGRRGYYFGSRCDICNNSVIPTASGPGRSPSTQDGNWVPEPLKASGGTMESLIKSKAQELFKLQSELGEGDEIIEISKSKIETIGTVMNDFKSFRVDPIGKLRIDGVNVALEGVYPTLRTSPHVEYVDVDDLPGGDYNLTCTNKYKLLVGAKGINIKTFGPIDMYGTIVNLAGEQVNISSQNEVLIDGGQRFSIRARKISLIPVEHQPVVIDGQLHVTRNTIIGGGMHVDGELSFLHATVPYEFGTTEFDSPAIGAFQTSSAIDAAYGESSKASSTGHTHFITPHVHVFKRPPFTFLRAKEAVRDQMIENGINSNIDIASSALLAGVVGGPLPPEAYNLATEIALRINNTSGSTGISTILGSEGEYTIYRISYNCRYPQNLRLVKDTDPFYLPGYKRVTQANGVWWQPIGAKHFPNGLAITIKYNGETKEAIPISAEYSDSATKSNPSAPGGNLL